MTKKKSYLAIFRDRKNHICIKMKNIVMKKFAFWTYLRNLFKTKKKYIKDISVGIFGTEKKINFNQNYFCIFYVNR